MQQWVRFSAKAAAGILSAWLLLLPVTANALGLGNIKMDSALNEPLKAQIPLISANADDVKGLKVKLASREAFLRAGVDRTALLSHIKFNIVKKNSKYYVELSTAQAVREPFLNFLVELNYKKGRMLREYTVLLDPAGHKEVQQTAQAPETTPPVSAPAAKPAPLPTPSSPFMGESAEPTAPIPAPSAQAKSEQAESPLLPAPSTKEAPSAPTPQAAEPAPEPAPEPVAPAPAPAPTAAAPAPAPAPMPEKAPAPEEAAAPAPQPFEAQNQDNGELFPGIPLTAYKETGQTAPSPAGEEASAPEPEPIQPAGELDYGITKKGDNLWSIAKKMQPNNQVTVYQVMMALQKSNPKAFVHGNINRLKVGQAMRIDNPSLLTAMSKAQARKQYQVQTQDWQNYLAARGAKVPRQTIEAGDQSQAPSSSGVPSGQLTLSTPQSKKMGAGSGSSDAESKSADVTLLEQQARKAMQEAKTQRKKNAELTSRLNDLETELKHLQNLVTIKDSDLAKLQRKLDDLNKQRAASGSQPTPTPPAAEKSETETQTAAASKSGTAAPVASEKPATPEQPAVEPAAPTEQASTPDEAATAKPEKPEQPATPATSPASKPVNPAAPPAPPVAAPRSPSPSPAAKSSGGIMGTIKGFFGGVMGGMNAMMLIIGGVIVVVILLLIFILMRRRKGTNFQESILTGGGDGEADSVAMDASSSQGSSLMGGESSFLSDFAISGVSAIQAEDSEVDPLTEADVFMAYGRYEAAEERLQEAIAQDPDRGELRVKLLELFNTTKNKGSFESAAEDFYAALGGNVAGNPLWQKVLAMGRELAPDNPLFTGGVATSSSAPAAPTASAPDLGDQQDVMDIGLDTGVFNTSDFDTDGFADAGQGATETQAADSSLDFNLDFGQAGADANPGAGETADTGLDFSLDMEPPKTESDQDMSFNLDAGSDDLASSGLDFNLDTGEEATAETQAPETHDDLAFNLNLDGDEEPTATDINLGMNDEEPSMAGLDFDFGESGAAEAGSSGGNGMDLDASDASMGLDMSGSGDEVGTKLDLARAYIDMGDPDGARSILDEVLEEGSDGQKQEAQQLMTQIG